MDATNFQWKGILLKVKKNKTLITQHKYCSYIPKDKSLLGTHYKFMVGVWKMTHWVKCLLYKH